MHNHTEVFSTNHIPNPCDPEEEAATGVALDRRALPGPRSIQSMGAGHQQFRAVPRPMGIDGMDRSNPFYAHPVVGLPCHGVLDAYLHHPA